MRRRDVSVVKDFGRLAIRKLAPAGRIAMAAVAEGERQMGSPLRQ
jgi:hypothetical protein